MPGLFAGNITMRCFLPKYIALLLLTLFSLNTQAKELTIAVSIKPLFSLVEAVTTTVHTPELVFKADHSPHHSALTPSVRSLLEQADLIVWIGPTLEQGLTQALKAIPAKKILTLEHLKTLKRYPLRDHFGVANDHTHQHGHDHHHDHQHCGHCQHHGNRDAIDPHYWLDPENAGQIVNAIATRLKELDPEHAKVFAQNKATFDSALKQHILSLKTKLAAVTKVPYLVFHDGYQYFEKFFGLNPIGALSLHPEMPLSAKRVSQLQKQIKHKQAVAIFSEPQFSKTSISALLQDIPIQHGVLDPIGVATQGGPQGYFELLDNLANGLHDTLLANELVDE